MKNLELAYSHSESTLVQSPRHSAFISCFTDSGWEVVCVTPTQHVDADERRRHGEEFTFVPTSSVFVKLPSGKKCRVSLSKKGCYYV
jgi:hypothetical protein